MEKIGEQNLDRVNRLVENISGIKKTLKSFVENHKKIANYIRKKYSNKNSVKSYLSTLQVVLNKAKRKDLAEIYNKESKKLNEEYYYSADTQLPANYISYEEIKKKRDEWLIKWSENIENDNLNQQALILSLYTYQPPVRLEYVNMKITKTKPSEESKDNYLWIRPNDKYTFVYKKGIKGSPPINIDVESKKLISIIDRSLKHFPRTYLLALPTNPNKPIGTQIFWKHVRKIFGKTVSSRVFRVAYITYFYSKKHSNKQKLELAKKMRHSIATASHIYKKVIGELDPINDDEDEDEEKKKETIEALKKALAECKEKVQQWSKKHYDSNKYEILRRKILRNLNNGNTNYPTHASIKKYNLKFDEEEKIWS